MKALQRKAAQIARTVTSMSDNAIKEHLHVDFDMSYSELDTMTREQLVQAYYKKLIWEASDT